MRFDVTPEDFMKQSLVDPGFHPAQIISYDEKVSKPKMDERTGQMKEASNYIEMQFKIVAGPSKGVVIYQNYSEKAPAFIVPLIEALKKDRVDKKQKFSLEPSREMFLQKFVDIHVVRGSWNNKPKNEIDGYRPYTGPSVTEAPRPAGV